MRFKTTYSKLANLYFFIQNLSEWHFSCRKQYNIFWRSLLNKPTTQELNALESFRTIHQRYPFGPKYLGNFFINSDSKKAWEKLKKKVDGNDYKKIRSIFQLFSKQFEKLWSVEEPSMRKWKTLLSNELKDKQTRNKIHSALGRFYNLPKNCNQIVKIYLLLSSPEQQGGGANLPEGITLEISRRPFSELPSAIGLIWHETAHFLLKDRDKEIHNLILEVAKSKYPKLLDKIYSVIKRSPIEIIKEAILTSLLPRGYLGQQILKTNATSLHSNPLIDTLAQALLPLTKQYIQNKKPLNEEYTQKALEIIKKQEPKLLLKDITTQLHTRSRVEHK